MKIWLRIFLSCLTVVCLCLYYPLSRLAETMGTHYREGVEDSLADQANILAALAEEELRRNSLHPDEWKEAFRLAHSRSLAALIYDFRKERVDSHVYITDRQGVVIFDSANPDNVGKSFAKWRDVYLTLRGEYGARTTRRITEDETTSVLHVAAPIHADGKIAGVLTVAKPTTTIRYFVEGARRNIIRSGLLSLAAAAFLCLLISLWLTMPVKRLTCYARGIRDGETPEFPRLDSSEIGEMGRAFAEMQETLEGKRYVEQYVQHLTHELKSPLSAIRGAAELLHEPMDETRRQRFIANIDSQSLRIQKIVDRMLELASLESPSYRKTSEQVHVRDLVRSVCVSKEPLTAPRKLVVQADVPEDCSILADGFLLQQALANMVQNAIDFSPDKGLITIEVKKDDAALTFTVSDEGPGIPDFATDRVFEKFFSLQRPSTGHKSTGLGLNFVMQVALLHGGRAVLENRPGRGARSLLIIGTAEKN